MRGKELMAGLEMRNGLLKPSRSVRRHSQCVVADEDETERTADDEVDGRSREEHFGDRRRRKAEAHDNGKQQDGDTLWHEPGPI